MSKKVRVKKPNNVLRARRVSSAFISGMAIAQINKRNSNVVDLKCCLKHPNPTARLVGHFIDHPRKWSILLCVFCKSDTGEQYLKTEFIKMASPYYQRDLIEFLQTAHGELIASCNSKHRVNVGWIASPHGVEFDLVDSEILLDRLGAWKELEDEH